ncbi:hypothetical protein FRC98_00065 [Lujinxingia vulgaris]|uniref:Uncharacterized protein n=1 Tax=Lujinxingia vulgaris TaxID=2600176 RepID=A0A5C6XG49_9DELT|nr:hypothetical protein [Lujinxingia vulgaris]TXD38834.1 hypothetical protein FRC98_00065 [Lujinxingia vulgaris]
MLKQLFKRFRHTGDPSRDIDHPHLQKMAEQPAGRSYLELLLDEVRPAVIARLEQHPESDPVLEIAAAALMAMFPARFEALEGPLSDASTPRHNPPPPPESALPPIPVGGPPAPPISGPAERDEDSEAFETLDENSVVGEVYLEDEEDSEVFETLDESSVVGEVYLDDEEDSEVFETLDESSVVGEVYLEDEETKAMALDETGEVAVDAPGGDAPAGFVSALDDTAEFDVPPVRAQQGVSWPVPLDEPEMLHGARVLLAVLLDNDRLPFSSQLDVAELLVAADLWTQIVAQARGVEQRVDPLARLVEQKFAAGSFGQVKLLLQLFPANAETRISNDRQIFYEDMILRMGIRRRQPLSREVVEGLKAELAAAKLNDDARTPQVFSALQERAGVAMHLYTREPSEVEPWREVAKKVKSTHGRGYLMGMIPPRRWRAVSARDERPLLRLLNEHLVKPMARDHIIQHLKATYFVLRAVGDTGLESYLDDFFTFSSEVCGVDAERFMPEIYRRTLGSAESIGAIFLDIYARHYRDAIEARIDALDEAAIMRAYDQAMGTLAGCDFAELAPGEFNLGGFVLDQHLGLKLSNPAFGFKLYRLG